MHNSEHMRTMNIIRSRFHNIFTETVNKVSLSADDDKRVVMGDKISTLAIGHYRAEKCDIANIEENVAMRGRGVGGVLGVLG